MPESVNAVAFGALALAAVAGAIGVIATRDAVRAAFWLLEAMVSTAGLFLLLGAEFIALVQLLVYAGAVAVLTICVVVLTLRRREDAERPLGFSMAAAALTLLFGAGATLVSATFRAAAPVVAGDMPDVAAFGRELFTTWVLPFEIASLVLLVALIGALWWSGRCER